MEGVYGRYSDVDFRSIKNLACWWEVVAPDKRCRSSIVREIDMPLVKVLDRKGGPVQYRARWIDNERRLCKFLVPHLGHTTMLRPKWYKARENLNRKANTPQCTNPLVERNSWR